MRRRRPAIAAVGGSAGAAVLLLAGCSSSVDVEAPAVSGAVEQACSALVGEAPESVAGGDRRDVETTGSALAWGEPAIVLRCGVAASPDADGAIRCDTVNGVDWFTEEGDEGYRFTTIGREPVIRLDVPYDYEPAGDALVDVATAVRRSTTAQSPCT
jgi:hypothetical protein